MSYEYDVDTDGTVFSETEIMQVFSNHYMFYHNLPWFMKIYYKPWIGLLDSLVLYLAPTYVARAKEHMLALNEVSSILEESSDENSNS